MVFCCCSHGFSGYVVFVVLEAGFVCLDDDNDEFSSEDSLRFDELDVDRFRFVKPKLSKCSSLVFCRCFLRLIPCQLSDVSDEDLGLSVRHSLSLSSWYIGAGLVVYAKVIALLRSSIFPG